MPLTIKPASGSGSMTLISVAGTTTNDTLTLPAKTGNIITSADSGTVTGTMLASATVAQSNLATNVAGNGPAVFAYPTSNTTASSSTWTKVALNSVASPGFDTNSNFDTTNNRFKPTVAGYYAISATLSLNSSASSFSSTSCAVYKNGSIYAYGVGNPNSLSANSYPFFPVTAIAYLNGSTDYLEIWFYSVGTSVFAQSGSTNTFLSCALVRAA